MSDLSRISDSIVNDWLSELPISKQAEIRRKIHIRHRLISLLATRLLKRYTEEQDISDFRLSDIVYPEQGKPGWNNIDESFDFNISHSDKLIVVVAAKQVKLGIDVEKIRKLNNLNFKMVLSPSELQRIKKQPDVFFDIWSKKEAVVKAADTTGLARMRDVRLKDQHAFLDDNMWHLKNIKLDDRVAGQYVIRLASSQPVDKLFIRQVQLDELLAVG